MDPTLPRTRSLRAPLGIVSPLPAALPSSEAVLDGCVRASYLTSRDPVLYWTTDAPPRIFLFVKKWHERSSLEACLSLGRWLVGLGCTIVAGADAGDSCPLPSPEFARLGLQPDGSVISQADVDMAIVVGGDGCVMHASALFDAACPPVLALGVGGSLGFLTAHSTATACALLCRVMHLPPEAGSSALLGALASPPPSAAASQPSTGRASPAPSSSAASLAAPYLAGCGEGEEGEGGLLQQQQQQQQQQEEEAPPPPPRAPGTAGVSMRMRLQVEVHAAGSPTPSSVHVVLNELHLGRGSSPVMTRINASVDGEPLTTVLSDGLIVSTQTGSTAYALSAGGSILSPSTRGIMFCPICPHTLSFRPLVLSDAAVLRLDICAASRGTCLASFDGRPGSVELGRGDFVVVRACPWPLPLLVLKGPISDWLLGLHQKLLWNARGDGFHRAAGPRSGEQQRQQQAQAAGAAQPSLRLTAPFQAGGAAAQSGEGSSSSQ